MERADSRLRNRSMAAGAAVLATLLVLEFWCVSSARRSCLAGDEAYRRGDPEAARKEWEGAASRPSPFNRYAGRATESLLSLESELERGGRYAEALRLCLSLEGVIEATGGYWSYYTRERDVVRQRTGVLADRLGIRFAPDRFTPFRPLRHAVAHGAIFCFLGFSGAALLAIRAPERERRALFASLSAGAFILWLLLLSLS